MTPTLRLAAGAALAAACAAAAATELVYTPVNPTFGGNPNNAAGLLNAATAQNDHKAPVVPRATTSSGSSGSSTGSTQLDRFTTQLQRAILDRLSSTAVSNLFDADGKLLANRTISTGQYVIAITEERNGSGVKTGNLQLTVTDKTGGASTNIVIGNVDAQ